MGHQIAPIIQLRLGQEEGMGGSGNGVRPTPTPTPIPTNPTPIPTNPTPIPTYPYDGVCGDKEVSNPCVTGDMADLSDTEREYRWLCLGGNGGSDADGVCKEPKENIPVHGVCNNAEVNACFQGIPVEKPGTPTEYRWDCNGIHGGGDEDDCHKRRPIKEDGVESPEQP